MPYIPRAPVPASCAHCGTAFSSTHLRRKYCCNSCNVLAAQARKKAQLVATPQGPTACLLPARYRAQVGLTRTLGAPFLLDPADVMDYAVGVDYWVQAHKSQAAMSWVAPHHRMPIDTRAFYVSVAGHVWVRDPFQSNRYLFVNAIGPRPEYFSRLCWQEEDPGPWTE